MGEATEPANVACGKCHEVEPCREVDAGFQGEAQAAERSADRTRFPLHARHVRVGGELDLGETSEALFEQEPLAVVGDGLFELGHELRPLGAWADEGHLAAQHIPELRQLVDVGAAEEPTHGRDPARRQAGTSGVPVIASQLLIIVRIFQMVKGFACRPTACCE